MWKFITELFQPAPVSTMLDYLTTNHAVESVLAFVEKLQPHGTRRELWLVRTTSGECFAAEAVKGLPPRDTRRVPLRGENLEELLERYDFWHMRSDMGTSRDGIHYSVIFASRKLVRALRIWNPQPESRQGRFVEAIAGLFQRVDL